MAVNLKLDSTLKHTGHKLTSKVKDESFNIDELHNYNLYLNIGYESFEFCAVKNDNNKCILLEEYTFSKINSDDDLLSELKKIWENHHLLIAGFWKKVRISFKNQNFTFIPKSLYTKENNSEYINFVSDFDSKNEEIGIYKHISYGGINVFSYPKVIYNFIKDTYLKINVEITHQSSAIIESAFRLKGNSEDKNILLFVEKLYINITVIDKNDLIFSNRFYFSSSEDFIYYILLIYKELKLDAENDHLNIFGEVAPNSPLYESIHKYIRNSSFGKRPKFLNFSYHFDEVFDHKFFNTYAIHLCE